MLRTNVLPETQETQLSRLPFNNRYKAIAQLDTVSISMLGFPILAVEKPYYRRHKPIARNLLR